VIEVVWPPPSMADAVMPSIEQTFKNHKLLTDKMLELTAVPPGPYALFHHNSYVHERMTDVKTIVTRLLESRKLLTELTQREDALRPKKGLGMENLRQNGFRLFGKKIKRYLNR